MAPTNRETLCTNGFVIQRKDGKLLQIPTLGRPVYIFFKKNTGAEKQRIGLLLGRCMHNTRTPVLSPLAGYLFAGSDIF